MYRVAAQLIAYVVYNIHRFTYCAVQVYRGTLHRPRAASVVFLPQRPLMTAGTLRDQVIYPDSRQEMERKGWRDSSLETVLDTVSLCHILAREGGWDARQDWRVRFSNRVINRQHILELTLSLR